MSLTQSLARAVSSAGSLRRETPNRQTMSRVDRGLFLDRDPTQIPEGGLQNCNNVRIHNGEISNSNMGWTKLLTTQLLQRTDAGGWDYDPCIHITKFTSSAGADTPIFGTVKDLLKYDSGSGTAAYITPRYEAGTISTTWNGSKTIVTGSGTAWDTTAAGQPRKNVLPGDQISIGATGRTGMTDPWASVGAVNSDTEFEINTVIAPDNGAGTAYTIRRVFGGNAEDLWSDAMFLYALPDAGDRWYATNGEYAVKWDGAANQVSYLNLGFTCRVMHRHKNIMVYGDITSGSTRFPQRIRTSEIGKPESVTNGNATELAITDRPSQIQTMAGMADSLLVYFNDFIQMLEFVGPPAMWVITTVVPDVGALSSRSVATLRGLHFFASSDGLYQFDGQRPQLVAEQVFPNLIQGSLELARATRAILHIDDFLDEAHVILPLTTDANTGVSSGAPSFSYSIYYDAGSQGTPFPVAKRDLPATSIGCFDRADAKAFNDVTEGFNTVSWWWNARYFSQEAPTILFGDETGWIFQLNQDTDHNGQPIDSFAEFGRIPVAGERCAGMILRMEPFANQEAGGAGNLDIVIGTSDRRDGVAGLPVTYRYDLTASGSRLVPAGVKGRYADIRFATNSSTEVWTLSGFALETVPMGTRP